MSVHDACFRVEGGQDILLRWATDLSQSDRELYVDKQTQHELRRGFKGMIGDDDLIVGES